jgi:hypothetical protein
MKRVVQQTKEICVSLTLQSITTTGSGVNYLRYKHRVAIYIPQQESSNEATVERILNEKKLAKEFVEFTTLLAHKHGILQEFSEYLQNPTINYSQLKSKVNLSDLFTLTNLPKTFINRLIHMQGRGVGKGEVALISLIIGCENTGGRKGEAKGDIKIGDQDIEIKVANAQLVPYDLAGYGSKPVAELKKILGKDLELNRGKWTDDVQQYFAKSQSKGEILVRINKVIAAFYSNKLPAISQDILEKEGLTRYITDNLAKLYIGKGKHIMLIDQKSSAYMFIESYEQYLGAINSGAITISAFSDKLPRLEYRNR